MLDAILGALLPVVVALLLGAFAGWRHDEDSKAAQALNVMVLNYALPLTLFAGMVATPRATLLAQGPLALVLGLAMVVPFALAYVVARYPVGREIGPAALQAMACGLPAIPFTGVPILSPLLGAGQALLVVAVGGCVINVLVVPAALLFLSFDEDQKGGPEAGAGQAGETDRPPEKSEGSKPATGPLAVLRNALLKPLVVAPLAGLAVVLLGVPVPRLLLSAVSLLGGTVGGVSLFASGIILQAQKPAFSWAAAIPTVARNLLIPGTVLLVLSLLGTNHDLRKAAVLALALPAAPMQITLALRYKVAEQENASYLLFSSVLSMLTIAGFIWWLA